MKPRSLLWRRTQSFYQGKRKGSSLEKRQLSRGKLPRWQLRHLDHRHRGTCHSSGPEDEPTSLLFFFILSMLLNVSFFRAIKMENQFRWMLVATSQLMHPSLKSIRALQWWHICQCICQCIKIIIAWHKNPNKGVQLYQPWSCIHHWRAIGAL